MIHLDEPLRYQSAPIVYTWFRFSELPVQFPWNKACQAGWKHFHNTEIRKFDHHELF